MLDKDGQAVTLKITPEVIEAGVAEYRRWQESDEWDHYEFIRRIMRLALEGALPAAGRVPQNA